jgi:D-glycero-alpha-D-manno-heptose 1-phosphate guanylyltransferase
MAPVQERPFLDYLLSWLRGQGVEEVILCVGYKRSHIERFVGRGRKWGLRVKYSIERKLLGTGGATRKAARLTSRKTVLVVNGDTFVDVRLGELMKFHRRRKALATLAAVKVADSNRYGSLCLDRKGRITAFLEKSRGPGTAGSEAEKRLINAGTYIFERKLLKTIRNRGPVSLEKEVLPLLLSKKNVYGFTSCAYFLDIGVPKDLGRAQRELPERIRVSHPR